MTAIKRTDLGVQRVTNDRGQPTHAYDTGFSATCPRCGRELRGVHRLEAEFAETSKVGAEFRKMEVDAFEVTFRAELEGTHTIDGVACSP